MLKFVVHFDFKKLEIVSENPSEVLITLDSLGYDTPTVEKLLTHLFVEKAAYCYREYTIFIRY